MVTVGIRNLNNSLSKYITLVKSGEKVIITDHNKIVAELIPPYAISSESGLLMEYLEEQTNNGSVTRSTKRIKISKTKQTNKYDDTTLKKIYDETRNDR